MEIFSIEESTFSLEMKKLSVDDRKVADPMFSKVSEYLSINIKRMLWANKLVCLGAFEYEWYPESKTMCIHF